ncbi:CLUMA_CG000115, isoform A [Clunio marinus]|uniref:CLUMA_CG000115, isoform A n=1 Tax=Clunio marinus TaxID=568069 RepID=A0A1J1HF24_9DIPT|nr:CLUMA_CG000115, isoform A [Clunio marinus]
MRTQLQLVGFLIYQKLSEYLNKYKLFHLNTQLLDI